MNRVQTAGGSCLLLLCELISVYVNVQAVYYQVHS